MHAFKKARRGGVKGKKELQAGAKLKRGKKRVLSAEAERAPDHVVLEVGDRTGVPREDNLHCPVGCISCILATAAVLGLLWNLRSFVDTIDDNLGGAFQAGVCTVNGFEGPRPKEPSLAQSNLMSPPPPPAGMPLYFPKCYFKDATTADDTVACKNGEAKDAPKFFATAKDKEGKGQGYIPSGRWCPGVGLCRHLNVTFEGADGNQSVATSAQWTSTMARDLGAERASAADGEVTFTGRRWSQADYPTWSAGAFPEWFGAANGSAAGEGSAVSEAQLAAAFREYVSDPRGLEPRLPLDRESLDHRASTDSPYPYVGEWCAAPPHRPPTRPPAAALPASPRPPAAARAAPCSSAGRTSRWRRRRSPRSSRCTPRGRRRRATATTRSRPPRTRAARGCGRARRRRWWRRTSSSSSRRSRSTGWGPSSSPSARRCSAAAATASSAVASGGAAASGKRSGCCSISDERRV